jgi:hypothetical protein
VQRNPGNCIEAESGRSRPQPGVFTVARNFVVFLGGPMEMHFTLPAQ